MSKWSRKFIFFISSLPPFLRDEKNNNVFDVLNLFLGFIFDYIRNILINVNMLSEINRMEGIKKSIQGRRRTPYIISLQVLS